MGRRPRKPPREKDLTSRYLQGDSEAERLESHQRFSQRSKNAQQDKIEKTALIRSADGEQFADIERLPIGQVVQVYSLYYQVEHPTGPRLCSMRKTLGKLSQTSIVVGDQVRFRDTERRDELGRPEAVIEQVLPRQTILTRAEGFVGNAQHAIVANAQQMLIVASLLRPRVKWGLVDRMIVAAQSGGLTPLICLNKIDLAEPAAQSQAEHVAAKEVLAHYQSLGFTTFQVSASGGEAYRTPRSGIERVKSALAGKTTVLAGHSGVGKSTLISAIQPGLDIRIGEISNFNDKGRHTTSSARRYPLDIGGYVIDTPGVKLFGLWGVTAENLLDFFPDVKDESAPQWRIDSFKRIQESINPSQ
ncbi:MAG: ribosome small subunit-dependent GTPase A [Tepidisphaeraceae bacterium]|jgi:ribosome biogenesis GTPase